MKRSVLFIVGSTIVITSGAEAEGNDKIYWLTREGIFRSANLDGTDADAFDIPTNFGGDTYLGLEFDPIEKKMYWFEAVYGIDRVIGPNSGVGRLRRANLDGTEAETIVSQVHDPLDVHIDVLARKVYWTVFNNKIGRANLDGSEVEKEFILETISTLTFPLGVFVVRTPPVPAVGTFGLGVMVVVLLGAGTLVMKRRQAA